MSLDNFIESDLEEASIEWFEELGYERIYGPDIAPDGDFQERDSYADVVLKGRLRNSLEDINPGIPDYAIDEAIRKILIPQKITLLDNNLEFHKMITDGIDVSVKQSDGSYMTKQVNIFDWDNPDYNDWAIVSQFTIIENGIEKRPDLIVFVNGVPLVVIELKSSSDEDVDIGDAFNQIETYKETIPSLFVYNAFNIISDGINAQAGSLTANTEWYKAWKTMDGNNIAPSSIPELEVLLRGMMDKARFLDIIKSFIMYDSDGENTYKILAGYHQYYAVNKAIDNTIKAASTEGNKRIGVIWHTQGSGKSFSMVFYSGKLVINDELKNPTIVVITDRNDLDDQLFKTFDRSQQLLRCEPKQAGDRAELRSLLNGRSSGGVIFTTIQKFVPDDAEESMPILTNRRNVIVMCDEAHRSQYGFSAEVIKNKGLTDAHIKFGYAKYMRDALPNASYIGFTGTPIETTDKNTKAVFGDYIDIYDMTRAVEDGTTVKIYYESRIAKIELSENEKPNIDESYEEITENQEETQREHLKSKWSRLEAIVGAEKRVNLIAKDIVEHFENRQIAQTSGPGKVMIVCMSRRICVDMYNAITSLRPEWHDKDVSKGKIKVVMTGKSSDPKSWHIHSGTKKQRDDLAKRFKDTNDELQIIIVRDMWLTGFDVPSMNTMYIDKPMSGHNLMQAIARVNRVFKDKQGGLIVDYIGIADNLKSALSQYTESDKRQTGVDTNVAANVFLEKLTIVREILHGHDYSKFFNGKSSEKMKQIVETMDFIMGLDKDRKKDYLNHVTELARAYSLCSTTEVAITNNVEVGFHKAVKSGIIKIIGTNEKKKTNSQLDIEINQLISKSLTSDKVIDLFESIGLDKPNISILSDEFLDEVKNLPQKNVALELLNRLIKGSIKSYARRNLTKARKFSELLDSSIRKYQNRTIETTKIIIELLELAKEMKKAEAAGEASGLSLEELAFYDALTSDTDACGEIPKEELEQMSREIVLKIKNNLSVDWSIRKNVQAKMRLAVKKILKEHGYPKDKREEATKLIMEQTHLMCEIESEKL